MHALTTLSVLALSATIAHTATLPASFSVATLAKRKNGCYGPADDDTVPEKYFNFEDLHGWVNTLNSEVSLDITHTCDLAKGYVLKPGEQWTYCSNWAASTGSGDCEQDCIDSCSGSNTFPGSTALADAGSSAACILTCPSRCSSVTPPQPVYSTNRIDWAIRNDGSADLTIDFQTCVTDLNWELGGCKAGSEQTWNNIWYKMGE